MVPDCSVLQIRVMIQISTAVAYARGHLPDILGTDIRIPDFQLN